MPIVLLLMILFAVPMTASAETDLYPLLPEGQMTGWSRIEEPKRYQGDKELFLMIDGGADIYYEYGFSQALTGDYENKDGKFIQVEIYEMASPESAYGIYSFKTGRDGKAVKIGQAAFLEEYYLNFWKGNLLVTIVGSDSDAETVEAVTAFGEYIDEHYSRHAEKPELAEYFLNPPVAFAHLKYVRGSIGAMNSYVFDTKDVFQVREGVIGSVKDNQAFVFKYTDEAESAQILDHAATAFSASQRYSDFAGADNQCSMIDRDRNHIVIKKTGANLVAVIGQNPKEISALIEQIVKKLNTI